MELNDTDLKEIRLYLLGRLESERRMEQVEVRMLTDTEYYEELLLIEDEVIDQYLSGALQADEREAFERYFLCTPARVRKLKFARAFNRYVAAAEVPPVPARRGSWNFFRGALVSPARIALAAAAILVCCLLLSWWMYFNPNRGVSRGLASLEAAYRNRRPVETRISGFGYAPWSVTRDDSTPAFDATSRDRAERLLLDAAHEEPGPAAKHALGTLYLAEHKYDQAIPIFEEALKADERNARLHNDLGVAIFEKESSKLQGGEDERDIEALARSVEHFDRAVELDNSLLEAYFNRALAYQQMMLPQQAEESWREYLRRDASSPWAEEARRYLKRLEESKRVTSQNANHALQEFIAARRAGDDEAAWRVVAQNYTSAGNEVTNKLLDSLLGLESVSLLDGDATPLPALSYLARLETDRGGDRYTSDLIKHYEQAAPGAREALVRARGHMLAGYSLFTQSKFAEALREYTAAELAYERAHSQPGKVFAQYRLAHCYVLMTEMGKARLAFERLYTICETNQYSWLLAHCLYGLAHVSADSSEYSQAVDYSGRALAAFERAGDINGILRCLTQLADVNQSLNRAGQSLGYLRRGLALTGKTPAEPMQRWGILVQTAFNLSSLRLHKAALFYQKEALSLALRMERPLIISRSYGYVGSASAAVKLYAEALSSAQRAFETGMSMNAGTGVEIMGNASQQLGDILRQSGECGQAIAAYDRSIQLYGRLNFEYYSYAAHKGKLLCYIAGTDNRLVEEELRTVLDLFERYRSKITAESQRNSFFDKEQSVYDLAMHYEATRIKNPFRAFEYSEESRARSLLDARRWGARVSKKDSSADVTLPAVARPMTLAELQARMPEGAQILQYAVLDDRLLIWAVTKSGVRMEEANVGAELLAEKVRAYLAAVNKVPAGEDTGQARLAAEDLHKLLISPIEPALDKSKFLCIVPDKILHYLPYNALVSPTTNRYLIEEYDTGVAPSSTIFVDVTASAERKAGGFKERLFSAGNPRFSRSAFPSLSDLPSAEREAEAVSSSYGRRRVLLGGEAREQLFRSEIEKADVAHLALHYVVNPGSEMLSGFPLAAEQAHGAASQENSDGFLQFHEIYRMKLPRMRLVVLSACRTGIEQQYSGEGAVGVARPFLVAGVPVVVASLWPIDTDASAELMVNFHRRRIRDGLKITQALRQAQIEMARGEDVRYRHPYYWAPFIAIGGHARF